MTTLITTPNLSGVDDVYARLIELHAGLSDEESMRANARLILILINHVGDLEAVSQAIELAKTTARPAD